MNGVMIDGIVVMSAVMVDGLVVTIDVMIDGTAAMVGMTGSALASTTILGVIARTPGAVENDCRQRTTHGPT